MSNARDFISKLACCQSGDIIVARIAAGFRLSRVLDQPVGGPQLEQVVTVVEPFEEALSQALEFALRGKRIAWFQISRDEYEPLSRESERHPYSVGADHA